MGVMTDAPTLELHGDISARRIRQECPQAWLEGEQRFRFARADFSGATFIDRVDFDGAEFGSADFRGATLRRPASFRDACFHETARFDSVTFEGTVTFKGAEFEQDAVFAHPEEEEEVRDWPEETTFARWADFREAQFHRKADFGGARFESRARFGGARCGDDAVFTGATFARARTVGHLTVEGKLDLDRAAFAAPVTINVTAASVSLQGTRFDSLTSINLMSDANVNLADAGFSGPATLAGRALPPKVTTLENADVGNLALANVDLRACHFLGAHNLEGLKFEGGVQLRAIEGRWKTPRLAITDELGLPQRGRLRSHGARVRAERTAQAYRALRKGREDSGDSPGAADFYYGEMEMRRRSAQGFDRVLLPAYWATSGYALRAWRALAALALTVLLFGVALHADGFEPSQDFGESLLFSLESTTGLGRAIQPPNEAELTDLGQVLQIFLRLLGPLFFGLVLLALRGRVKR